MHIQKAAELTGLTPRAIRYYEQMRLLQPSGRSGSGYRLYSPEDIEKLRWISALRGWGLPLQAIQAVLQCLHDRGRFMTAIEEARSGLYESWLDMSASISSLDASIAAWKTQLGLPMTAHSASAADELRLRRQTKAGWTDEVGWNELAAAAGDAAPLQSLPDGFSEAKYRSMLQELADWIDPLPGECGADLGCGPGSLTRLLALGEAELIAIDISPSMLSLLEQSLPQVETRLGNLLSVPLPDRSCHFAASSFVLQHLHPHERQMALREMTRILLPGGRLALAAPLGDRELGELGVQLLHAGHEVYRSRDGLLMAVISGEVRF